MAAPLVRRTVAPGRVVYRGPGSHPFRAGDAIDLPADHADALTVAGHLVPEAEAPRPVAEAAPAP